MSDKTNTAVSSGLGLGGVLFVIFACGKLFKFGPFASWSWLKIIFMPILIDLGIVLAILALCVIIAFIIFLFR